LREEKELVFMPAKIIIAAEELFCLIMVLMARHNKKFAFLRFLWNGCGLTTICTVFDF